MTDTRGLTPLMMGDRLFAWGDRTYIMGILNVTPDSFSDGGQFNAPDQAMAQVAQMVAAGVDIIDVGGQSTRPGAVEISLTEELDRTIPIIEQIRAQYSTPISIDTTRAAVAEAAVAAGANLINDISGGTFDPEMFPTVARLGVPYVLMHIRGTPATMQTLTDYQDLIGEITTFFQTQIDLAVQAGVERSHLILDPGIGFAKTAPQNIELLHRLREFDSLRCPLLIGPSRKSFIGQILNQPDPQLRIWGTAGAAGGAIATRCDILRVHDVGPMVEVCRVADQILRSTPQTP
ncbi:dihydropteroate synthase [Spirulina sp. CCNP1310]|uniref:dihydropteroate synthase n=1 Tax=Spirulina sp. CCNP1310 TaxID=3110249 RepID=UPI002B214206|nr:dihydropteroate synthase [Spirulina sp. CCNP1310]MEA5418379.1 dihydropteroate synthase [Spirulina sp. CCNP1310]